MDGIERRVHGILTAGYTIMPEEVRKRAVAGGLYTSGEELLIGSDKALMDVEDPRDGESVPLIYPALRAGLESKVLASLTVVGSDAVLQRLPGLIAKARSELGMEGEGGRTVFAARMHYPSLNEMSSDSRTSRMDLEAAAMGHNLRTANATAPKDGIRMAYGHDLRFLDGQTIDSMLEDISPLLSHPTHSVFFPLVAKETLGRFKRLRRRFLRIIDDKFGSGIYKKDVYGRISIKEANVLLFTYDTPPEILDFIGSLYSIRKLANPASLVKALDIIGNDAAYGQAPFIGPAMRRGLALNRAFRLMMKYASGNLRITYAERMLDRMIRGRTSWGEQSRFSFFEMKYPSFCHDLDSREDLKRESIIEEGNLRANFSHLCTHQREYLGRTILLKGEVSSLDYKFDSELKAHNRLLGLLSSALGYKEIRFIVSDDGNSIPCYRFKYRNIGPNTLLSALIDRVYIPDEDSTLLDIDEKIHRIVTLPRLKYEELTRDLSLAEDKRDQVYVGGKVTEQGIWLHEIILPSYEKEDGLKKYYFRQHCPDPRCEAFDPASTTFSNMLQKKVDEAWTSSPMRKIYSSLNNKSENR